MSWSRRTLHSVLLVLLWSSPSFAEQQPPLWLWIDITGRAALAEYEGSIPLAIVQASPALEGVFLITPAWQEAPDIAHNPVIQRVLDECKSQDIKVVWCRRLWITWDALTNGRPQRATDLVTAAYYVSAMQHLAAEAAVIGAVGTCFDAEPYGGLVREALKGPTEISRELHLQMAEAIELAKTYATTPSFVSPGYHRLPKHWRWVFSHLAAVLSRTSYRARDPNHIHVRPNPPMDHTFNITWPGWWLVPKPWTEAKLTPPPLTVDEFRALDWKLWRARFPNIRRAWIYVSRSDMSEVCRQLGSDERRTED